MTPKEKARLGVLADKFLKNTISPSERAELEAWFREQRDEPLDMPSGFAGDETELETRMFAAIRQRTGQQERRTVPLWPRIAAAASILLAISAGGYFIFHQKQPVQIAQNKVHDIAPGHNQATLTLANGQRILLTKALSGQLAKQGNTTINIIKGGSGIAYTPGSSTAQIAYNTLSTGKGEMSPYPLLLPDGSKVWLNAASSITFPTAFTGKDREVTIKGEAYFEVAHNAAKPFRVKSADQILEVLGTHFDVNSYSDEPATKTTLLEGKVTVTSSNNRSALLSPGEQSILGLQTIKVVKADVDITMAWKEGMFRFDSTPLSSIMNQVARWYDVDIIYHDEALKNVTFFAMTTRFANVSQLLNNLEQTGEVKFSIEGRKIIVEKP